jgi:hypothetical protein
MAIKEVAENMSLFKQLTESAQWTMWERDLGHRAKGQRAQRACSLAAYPTSDTPKA